MGVCLTITFGLTLFVMYRIDQSHPPGNVRPANNPRVTAAAASKQSSPIRPIYRYSIVAGGVRSADEVAQAIRRDPVVADHYTNVRTADLREERVQEPMLVHASYRIGDKVFWTKRLLRLQPGEKILTDGTTTIRERCGNLLTTEPLAPEVPALIDEPLAPEFEVAVAPWAPGAGYTLDSPPALQPESEPPATGNPPPVGGIGPHFYYVPPGSSPPGQPDPRGLPKDPHDTPKDPPLDPPVDTPTPTPTVTAEPPTVVPEPGTWILLATGLLFVIGRAMASRRAL
jgi:hypothetical protein